MNENNLSSYQKLLIFYQNFKKTSSKKLYSYLEFLYYFRPRYLLCFIFGVLGGFGMTPFNILPFFIISIVSIIRLTDFAKNTKEAIFVGIFYSYGMGLVLFYWIPFAMLTDKMYYLLFPIAFLLTPLLYALFQSLIFFIYKEISYYTNAVERVMCFSSLWCLFEYIRSFTPINFPWALAGYTMMFSNSIFQFSSIIGVFGFSVFILFFSSGFHLIFLDGDGDRYYSYLRYILTTLITLLAMFVYGYLIKLYKEEGLQDKTIVRLVQGGVKAKSYKTGDERKQSLKIYKDITLSEKTDHITHIIWPESAVEFSIYQNDGVSNILKNILNDGQILITGSMRIEEQDLKNNYFKNDENNINNFKIYNTMSMIDSTGRQTYYDKHFLVPFGEYIPFKRIIPFLKSITGDGIDFSNGKETRVYKLINTQSFIPLICYEIAFSGKLPIYSSNIYKKESGERIYRERAKWIINITNDAWFGYTSGPFQHYQMSIARAIEYGIPVVRVANTGISAIIDPYGKVTHKIGLNKVGFIDAPIPKALKDETIFAIFGNIPSLIFISVIFLSLFIHYLLNKYYKKIIPITTQIFNIVDKIQDNKRDKRGD